MLSLVGDPSYGYESVFSQQWSWPLGAKACLLEQLHYSLVNMRTHKSL